MGKKRLIKVHVVIESEQGKVSSHAHIDADLIGVCRDPVDFIFHESMPALKGSVRAFVNEVLRGGAGGAK